MKQKKVRWQKYVLVLVATIIIFVFGLLLGSWTSSQKLSSIKGLQEDVRTQALDFETAYAVAGEEPCRYADTGPLIEELYTLSTRVDFMEGVLGPEDERVKELKAYYSLLQLRQWLFLQRVQKSCARNDTLVLFFYSNKPGVCPRCKEQGFVLTWLRKEYPSTKVFSFDADLDLTALDAVKERYNVSGVPFTVVNDAPIKGFASQARLVDLVTNNG